MAKAISPRTMYLHTRTKSYTLSVHGLSCSSESQILRRRRHNVYGSPNIRYLTSKSTFNVDELPQGILASPQYEASGLQTASYPTVVQQARNNMRKFDSCILLTRVGGFYELYFEHAEQYGPLLNIKVGYKKTTAGPVAMVSSETVQYEREHVTSK
jgi:hypothetical protein